VIQRVASCGAAVARELFCCARGCLFFSALPRAVPLLCARVLKGRSKARKQHPGRVSCLSVLERRFSISIRVYDSCVVRHYTSAIPGRGNSKAKLALVAFGERERGGVGVGLEHLDLPAARVLLKSSYFLRIEIKSILTCSSA